MNRARGVIFMALSVLYAYFASIAEDPVDFWMPVFFCAVFYLVGATNYMVASHRLHTEKKEPSE